VATLVHRGVGTLAQRGRACVAVRDVYGKASFCSKSPKVVPLTVAVAKVHQYGAALCLGRLSRSFDVELHLRFRFRGAGTASHSVM
jgi:hypothetical protein